MGLIWQIKIKIYGQVEEEDDARDLILRLPFDVVVLIAGHLAVKDLHSCWLVSRAWHNIFTNDTILYPLFMQLSHFEQESFMFQCLPSGHESKDEDEDMDDVGGSGRAEERGEMEERMRLEERASQQWLKDRRVLLRVMQNLMNRNRRWRSGQPKRRLYLPPVPMDGTDTDIRDEWQGGVRIVKMKAGVVAAVYEQGRTVRLWSLARDYDRVKEMTTEYIEQNRDALIAQRKHGAPPLPRFSDAQVETLLRCSQGADSGPAQLTVIRLAEEPACIDFFYMNKTLVTATRKGRVDVFDMNTARLRRTLQLNKGPDEPQGQLLGGESIDSVHVWLHYVIVSHGSRVTLWNHVTGELLEDGLETAHRARITGVFVLDDEQHLLSIDACGIMVVTDRSARRTLMDVPLYPVILTGAEGAPYSMRLLHMTHLCVWGRFSMGHYELYEPGLRNMPPLSSLIMSDADGNPGERPRAARPRAGEDARTAEARAALAQLESTHDSLEALYTQVAPDRVARASHDAAPEQRYHVLNIDSSIENVPEGQVLSVDFKHALLLRRQFMQICDFDQKTEHGEPPVGPSLGVFPVDRADHPEALRLDRMDIAEAVGSDSMECSKPADPIVADAESTDDELVDGESEESDEAAEAEYDFDWEFEESGQSESAQQRTADRLAQHPGPDIRKADLYQLESLTMRYIIGMQFAREDPRIFAQMPVNRVRLARARAFLNAYMPELLAALDADVELQDVMLVTPYYVQRAHEAKFPQPVELVDHRGQLSTARRLCADMQRVARVGGGSKWRPDHEQLVSPGVGRLRGLVAAMDDGRVAVGCENGYVVVTSFD